MMKVKLTDFMSELSHYGIEIKHFSGRIVLEGGDDGARDYYTALLKNNREFEGALIWKIAQTDADLMDWIEERRAMNWVSCRDDSIRSAIMLSLG